MLKKMRSLGFLYEPRLYCLGANPHALYLPVGKANANALNVGFENAIILLNKLQTYTAAFLALTFVNDYATFYRTLACY